MKKICRVRDLGLIPYEEAWELQKSLAAKIAEGEEPPTLLLLEHPHTYTFGRRGQAENLLWDDAALKARGVSVYWVDRGGDVTYHGPGQLVGYPLLPLGKVNEKSHLPEGDYIGYVRKLEETLLRVLAQFGVEGTRQKGMTGVWIPRGDSFAKIAAIGVKVDARGISQHGFALNVSPDMRYWEGIIGCGLRGYAVISLAEIFPSAPNMKEVKASVIQHFGEVFQYAMEKA